MPIHVKFWGVRGSIACSGPETVRYGGNTPCVEIRCGDRTILFDGGTGLRPFGNSVIAAGKKLDADLFLSHCHIDHIFGLPFFTPLFLTGHKLRIHAGNLTPKFNLKQTLRTMMSPPLFPVEVETFKAAIEYSDFEPGKIFQLDDGIVVRTAMLNHPGGSIGYRLEFDGKSLAYVTDTETPGPLDENLKSLTHGVDLVIFDATYTEAEKARRNGWGHSTWSDGVRLTNEVGAKTLCLFHHDPDHDDAFLDDLSAKAAAARPGTITARDGLAITL